jgi:hypothetical protein
VTIRWKWLVPSILVLIAAVVLALWWPHHLWCGPDIPSNCLAGTPWGFVQIGILAEGILVATFVYLLPERGLVLILLVLLMIAWPGL